LLKERLIVWISRIRSPLIGPNSVISDYLRMELAWRFARGNAQTRPCSGLEPLHLAYGSTGATGHLGFHHGHLWEDFDLGVRWSQLLFAVVFEPLDSRILMERLAIMEPGQTCLTERLAYGYCRSDWPPWTPSWPSSRLDGFPPAEGSCFVVFALPGRRLMDNSPKNPWACFFGDRWFACICKGKTYDSLQWTGGHSGFIPGRGEPLSYTCTLRSWSGPTGF
jgi:hypothetical protein